MVGFCIVLDNGDTRRTGGEFVDIKYNNKYYVLLLHYL